MIYGSVSQGFRIGGGNLANVTPLPPEDRTYQPDSLWSYEVGAKTSWFDRHLIVNSEPLLHQLEQHSGFGLH